MVGLLSFHWADDYGAMLQAYALKHYLESLGEEAEFIPYAPFKFTGRYWWMPLYAFLKKGYTWYIPSPFSWKRNLRLGKSFWERRRIMAGFRCHYLCAAPPKRTLKNISLKKYTCVLVGSDQVWNPAITVGLSDAYLGNLQGKENCRLVSYAASFGGSCLPAEYLPKFAQSVGKNFAAISLREKSAAPFVEGLLHRKVTDVLDPVFLLQREEWEKLENRPQEKGYILTYWTKYDRQLMNYLRLLSEKTRKKVLQLNKPGAEETPGWIELRIAGGPREFIGYIQNAACVITNSFHATAFSILLEKPFFVFRHSSWNSRMEDLLKKLQLQAHMTDESAPPQAEDIWKETDWGQVRRLLETERERSAAFIRDNLKGEEPCRS